MMIELFDKTMLMKVNKETHNLLRADLEELYLPRAEIESFVSEQKEKMERLDDQVNKALEVVQFQGKHIQ